MACAGEMCARSGRLHKVAAPVGILNPVVEGGRVVKRYRDPANPTTTVSWTSRHDSAGRTLARQEPGESEVDSQYDEWGQLVPQSA